MKTPLAIRNLWHQRIKTLVSVGGVAFALLLVFMQLGFMGAVSYTAANVLDRLDFDILIRPRDYLHLYEAGSFDRRWLRIAESTAGVDRADPFWIMIQNWRKLPSREQLELLAEHDAKRDGYASEGEFVRDRKKIFEDQFLPIAIMAVRPTSKPEDDVLNQIVSDNSLLFDSATILLDNSTQVDYGPWEAPAFGSEDIARSKDRTFLDRIPEIGGAEYEIGDLFKLGTGLAANAAAIMGDSAFARISPWDVNTTTSLGLVRLEPSLRNDPRVTEQVVWALRERAGVHPEELQSLQQSSDLQVEIEKRLGIIRAQQSGEVEIMSKSDAIQREKHRWLWETPIGLIFQMGVLLSLVVGAVIVYMVLSTDVTNRLPEYATLLAMGYSRKFLAGIVMTQAMVLCALGFVAALGAAEVLYRVTTYFSKIPLTMDLTRVVLVGVLGVLMCNISGLLAMRKLWKAEPASLF